MKFSLRSCEKKLFGRFWQKTVPLLINNLAWGIGFSMYSVIMGHLGTDAVAANGIANISKNLVVHKFRVETFAQRTKCREDRQNTQGFMEYY